MELCVALVLNVVCKSATWGSCGFVSQWVSEWEQCHGWLMNDCVFITIPPSHHRDAHSPLQVSAGCTGILGPDPGSLAGVSAVPSCVRRQRCSVSCTERDVVSGWVKALRPPLRTSGPVNPSQWLCTEAPVSWWTWGERSGKSPVHSNASMHRGGHSLGEEKRQRLSGKRRVCTLYSLSLYLRLHDVPYLWSQDKQQPLCEVVPPTHCSYCSDWMFLTVTRHLTDGL